MKHIEAVYEKVFRRIARIRPEDVSKLLSPDRFSNKVLGSEVGIPWVWVCGGALVTILAMAVCLFTIVLSQGFVALWPKTILEIESAGQKVWGSAVRSTLSKENINGHMVEREKFVVYTANQDAGTQEFLYVDKSELTAAPLAKSAWSVERTEWGPFIGTITALEKKNGHPERVQNPTPEQVNKAISDAKTRKQVLETFEDENLSKFNHAIEEQRLERKATVRKMGEHAISDGFEKLKAIDQKIAELQQLHDAKAVELASLREENERYRIHLKSFQGYTKHIPVSQVVRAYQPNELGFAGRLKVFVSRVWEFLSEEPREANSAGGVAPAIFGTVAMTLLMTLAVLPIGVLTAVYIREIAKQGFLVSIVRVAVGNLAGVPSIVYGVFGLGFFCYTIGTSIDRIFFVDKLPNPTFGTGGILWASLTLAMLTVPVVIVSTEEALSAVPRSLREASYGCGATRLQTLWNIVLPKAMPGILTGLILAMARGVGEVAPLLMTGVVKLAPALPVDGTFPFIHLERSFMHLGFHIYDLGFQSRSAEFTRPLVFASTSLLIGIVLTLNFAAIKLRSSLKKRFEGRGTF